MEDYERRKLYRIHLKNISEIKNCRTPKNHIAYPSRLFNFDLGIIANKDGRKTAKQCSQNKTITDVKRFQQKFMQNFLVQKQNFRLSSRILNACGSISMCKHEKQYLEHRKIMNLHRKVKEKRIIMYRIHDIMFKGATPNLTEIFCIYDMTKTKLKDANIRIKNVLSPKNNKLNCIETRQVPDQFADSVEKQKKETVKTQAEDDKVEIDVKFNRKFRNTDSKFKKRALTNSDLERKNAVNKTSQKVLLLSGNIFQLRKSMIKGYKDEKIKIKIVGRTMGQACLQQAEMIPIMHHKQIVGSLIVQMC